VVALEIFIQEGDLLYEKQMKIAEYIREQLLETTGLAVTIIPNDGNYYEHIMMPHVPRVLIEWDKDETGFTAEDMDRFMMEEDPPVFLRNTHYHNYYTGKEWRMIDTYCLRPPEEEIVVERIKRVFSKHK